MKSSLKELVKDTVEKNHKENFYKEVKQMIDVIDAQLFDEKCTDTDISMAEIDDDITWEEKNELRRQNISYKRHGFERIKAIAKSYENIFKND